MRRFLRIFPAVLLVLALCPSARAQRKPRAAARRARKPPAAAQAPASPPKGVLAPGRWTPEVRSALEKLIARDGKDSPGYTTEEPPIAVFGWEDVSFYGNPGEQLFHRLVVNDELKIDRAFWELVPLHYGRERIRAGYEGFHGHPRVTWEKDPYYQIYRKGFFKCYQSICREVGRKECSLWLATLLTGLQENEVKRMAAETLTEALEAPLSEESVREAVDDDMPVKFRLGLRKLPEMEDLYRKLALHGFDVWIMGFTSQWVLEPSAKLYPIHPTRIFGVRLRSVRGVLTSEPILPIPAGSGKVEAIAQFMGRSPSLILVGPDERDALAYGRGLRVMVADPDSSPALEEGWLLQPSFSPSKAPQFLE